MATHHPDHHDDETNNDVDQLVEQLTAKDDDLRCNGISEAQAAAVVRRDLADHTRLDVATEFDISKSTVDKRTYGGRDHVTLAARTALAADETGVLAALADREDADDENTPYTDLLDALEASADVELRECEICGEEFVSDHGVSTHPDEGSALVGTCGRRECLREVWSCDLCERWSSTMNRHESGLCVPCASLKISEAGDPDLLDGSGERDLSDLWADLARLDATKKLLPGDDGGSVLVEDAEPEDFNEIQAWVDATPGIEIWKATPRGENVKQIILRPPEEDADDVEDGEEVDMSADESDEEPEEDVDEVALTCHYCGDEFVLDDDSADLAVSWNEDADHPVCPTCLGDVAMGGEKEPLPEFRDEPATDDRGVDATEGLPEPFATLTPKKSGNEHEKRRAIHAVAQYVADHDDVKAADLKNDVYPEHNAGYGSARSWWENVARDGLKDVGAEVEGSGRASSWVIDADVVGE